MFLNNETGSPIRIATNIYNLVDTITSVFKKDAAATSGDHYIKWNCDNHLGTILNVDGSCNGTPIHIDFGSISHNNRAFSSPLSQV